jgi:hypothetical protein
VPNLLLDLSTLSPRLSLQLSKNLLMSTSQ